MKAVFENTAINFAQSSLKKLGIHAKIKTDIAAVDRTDRLTIIAYVT